MKKKIIILFFSFSILFGILIYITYNFYKKSKAELPKVNYDSTYRILSPEGNPLVDIDCKNEKTTLVVWINKEAFIMPVIHKSGKFEWNMKTTKGSDVIDWDGDGLIDVCLPQSGNKEQQEIRIGKPFFKLKNVNGEYFAGERKVLKKDGEWIWVNDSQ
jgi:hypothetical protein